MAPRTTIVWLRGDLRLADNPALAAAVARGDAVVPLFAWSPEEDGPWEPGGASRWWLDASLRAFAKSCAGLGSPLLVRSGPVLGTLQDVAAETGAAAVFWNRRCEPAGIALDRRIKQALREGGLEAESFPAGLLGEPWASAKADGTPYRVFTPFWKALRARDAVAAPLAAPAHLPAPARHATTLPIEALRLAPRVDWAAGLREAWAPGEGGARALLARFLEALPERAASQATSRRERPRVEGRVARAPIDLYASERDRPDHVGTSRLSPHLHFGELSPRTVWEAVREARRDDDDARDVHRTDAADDPWLRQIAWREFAHHLLFHFPATTDAPLRAEFDAFPWRQDPAGLRAWQRGLTGYPIVDAGMRELWTTGWMHNRVRMIAASFLVKDLRVHWIEGARWFWDTLVDADLANNTLGWQWTAGCGADAAPYFRIFNPVTQGGRFDPDGAYVRRWVPELAALDALWIHAPWTAPPDVLATAGVRLGTDYPAPIVDHDQARRAALAALATIRRKA